VTELLKFVHMCQTLHSDAAFWTTLYPQFLVISLRQCSRIHRPHFTFFFCKIQKTRFLRS